MVCSVKDIPVYYEEYGEGKPILFIHGYSLDHRMMTGCMEPIFITEQNFRRIYIDLPGMGQTPCGWVKTSEDMLEILVDFINAVIGNGNLFVAGQSFGGFLTLGLIDRISERIDGTVLLCPLTTYECLNNGTLPEEDILFKSMELDLENPDEKEYAEYAVIVTPEGFERYKNEIQSGIKAADSAFLFNGGFSGSVPRLDNLYKTLKFDKPACIITGRQDNAAGYSYANQLLDGFPRATFAVLDCAGHNLQIESAAASAVFEQLIRDWIWRVSIQ